MVSVSMNTELTNPGGALSARNNELTRDEEPAKRQGKGGSCFPVLEALSERRGVAHAVSHLHPALVHGWSSPGAALSSTRLRGHFLLMGFAPLTWHLWLCTPHSSHLLAFPVS